MQKANQVIRLRAVEKGVRLWQVAEELGIHYVTLNTWLRNELPIEKKSEIIKIIDSIAESEKI